ncbi:MAG: hypothetical protein IPJ98_11475 [Bryobacterales bacterium]|nr:hypothetical protein [Bryobacterales bacterium]
MMTCKQAATLLHSGEAQTLGLWRRIHLGLHLSMCGPCARLRRQLEQMRQAASRLRATFVEESSHGHGTALATRILDKLRNTPPNGESTP